MCVDWNLQSWTEQWCVFVCIYVCESVHANVYMCANVCVCVNVCGHMCECTEWKCLYALNCVCVVMIDECMWTEQLCECE